MSIRSLLHFNGTNGSTVFTDVLGAFTWTPVGGAVLGTAQKKFGTASLDVTGGGELDSSTFTISSVFTADAWVYFTSVAGNNAVFSLVGPSPFNATSISAGHNGFGALYKETRTGAAINGSVTGTKTTWSTGQWYHFAVCYDSVATKYYFYVDGVKDGEITDATAPSGAGWKIQLGADPNLATALNGYLDEFRFTNATEYPSGTTFTPETAEYVDPINNGTMALILPTITLTPALGGVLGEGAANLLLLPVLTMDAAGVPIGSFGSAALVLPRVDMTITGLVQNIGQAAINLPLLRLLSTDDMNLRVALPTLTLSASGVVGAVGEANLIIPSLSLTAQGFSTAFYNANVAVPLFTITAQGISGILGTASLILPKRSLLASGSAGGVGTVNIILPSLSLAGTGYGQISIAGAPRLPMLQLVASGYQSEIGNYRVWALNAHKGALTEYTNFPFNSFTEFGSVILAAGASGIHVLDTSDNDNSVKIAAAIRWGNLAYGSSFNKRIPRAYLGARSNGYGKFKTVAQGQGERAYLLPSNGNFEIQQRRIPIGRGPKSTYWQFGYENVDGADFAINSLILLPEQLRRRVF